jgi:hypothetical protein
MDKVRYRDPDRVDRSRMFLRRADAEEFAASVETDSARGQYLDPAAGKVTWQSGQKIVSRPFGT